MIKTMNHMIYTNLRLAILATVTSLVVSGCGDSMLDGQSWVTMRLKSLSPRSLPADGGILVTLYGSNLSSEAEIWLGEQQIDAIFLEDDTQLTFVAPPHAPGPVDIRVRLGSQQSVLADGAVYSARTIAFEDRTVLAGHALVAGVGPYLPRAGDFDGDDRDDVVLYGGLQMRVLQNRDGVLTKLADLPLDPRGPSNLDDERWLRHADVNADGLEDIVTTDSVYLSTGTGFVSVDWPERVWDALAADFTGDGSVQVALLYERGAVQILRFDGDQATAGSEVALSHPPIKSALSGLAAGLDLNDDGADDILYMSRTSDLEAVFIQTLMGPTLSEGWRSTSLGRATPLNASSLEVTDANGDGLQDVIATLRYLNSTESVFLGHGDGTFTATEAQHLCGLQPHGAFFFPGSARGRLVTASSYSLFACNDELSVIRWSRYPVTELYQYSSIVFSMPSAAAVLADLDGDRGPELLSRDSQNQLIGRYDGGALPRPVHRGSCVGFVGGRFGNDTTLACVGRASVALMRDDIDRAFDQALELQVDSVAQTISASAAGDMDDDGDDDLVVYLWNGSDGTLDNRLRLITVEDGHAISERDIDRLGGTRPPALLAVANVVGDGRPEVVLVEEPGAGLPRRVVVYHHATEGLERGDPVDLEAGFVAQEVVDLDGDGMVEISGYRGAEIAVVRFDSGVPTAAQTWLDLTGELVGGGIAAAHLADDGTALWIAESHLGSVWLHQRALVQPNAATPPREVPLASIAGMREADVNGDGLADLVLVSSSGTHTILLSDVDGVVQPPVSVALGSNTVAFIDLNHDGLDDILYGVTGGASTRLNLSH